MARNCIKLGVHDVLSVEIESDVLTFNELEEKAKNLLVYIKSHGLSTEPDARDVA